jgi:hypothetical protein
MSGSYQSGNASTDGEGRKGKHCYRRFGCKCLCVPSAVTTTVAYIEPLEPRDGRTAAEREPIKALGSIYSNEYACEKKAETTPAVTKSAIKWYAGVDSFRSEPGSRFGCQRYDIAAIAPISLMAEPNSTRKMILTRTKEVHATRVRESGREKGYHAPCQP